jgi:hypothetical protein
MVAVVVIAVVGSGALLFYYNSYCTAAHEAPVKRISAVPLRKYSCA